LAETADPDKAYHTALAAMREKGGAHGIDATLEKFGLDVILLPSEGMSW